MVAEEGRGVIVYLRGQEGRGIGLGHKLRAHILKDVGVNRMRLMTNNPAKFTGLKGYGLEISERIAIVTEVTEDNAAYIQTKRERMGHFWDGDEGDLKAFANAANNLEDAGVPAVPNLEGFEAATHRGLLEFANGTHVGPGGHTHDHDHAHHDHVHGEDGSCPNQHW